MVFCKMEDEDREYLKGALLCIVCSGAGGQERGPQPGRGGFLYLHSSTLMAKLGVLWTTGAAVYCIRKICLEYIWPAQVLRPGAVCNLIESSPTNKMGPYKELAALISNVLLNFYACLVI